MPRTRACRPAAPSGSASPQGDQHKQAVTAPAGVASVAAGRPLRLVWTNEAGGLTFEAGTGASRCFIKWAPAGSHLDLAAEADRMEWAGQFHPVPKPLSRGADAAGSWLVTAALDGENAVSRRRKADPATAVTAIGAGLRTQHPAYRGRPLVRARRPGPARNRRPAGRSGRRHLEHEMELRPRLEQLLLDAYGIAPDPERARYYRLLWDLSSLHPRAVRLAPGRSTRGPPGAAASAESGRACRGVRCAREGSGQPAGPWRGRCRRRW